MRILAITPPAAVQPRIDLAVVDAWVDAGAATLGLAVLIREPGASLAETLTDPRLLGLRERLAARGIPALASIAARPDPSVAAALLAARPALVGVQLRGDPSAAELGWWRAPLGPGPRPGLELDPCSGWVVGRSCHGPAPTLDGDPELGPNWISAADYTCVAPIFSPGTTQPGVVKRAIGLAALRRWTEAVPRVFALGGVDPSSAAECLAAGASGLAGISLFFGSPEQARDNVAALGLAFARASGPRPETEPGPDVPQARRRR